MSRHPDRSPKRVSRLMGRVDVVIVVEQYTTHFGPRPGPGRENKWAASWAGQSGSDEAHISWGRPGQSQFKLSAWLGPAPDNFRIGPATALSAYDNFGIGLSCWC